MKNKLKLITGDSGGFPPTLSPFFLNTYIEEREEDVVLYVESAGMKDLLRDKTKPLEEFYKKPIVILIDATPYKAVPEAPAPKVGKLMGSSFLIQEYIDTPYFLGESNNFAFTTADKFLSESNSQNIFFVYGGVGTGKSHLLHQMAYKAIQNGASVYLNNSNVFLEDIKDNFGKDRSIFRFISMFGGFDYCIVDDFQKFDNKNLAFAADIIFEIINTIISKGKRVVFSSDVSPYMYSFLHDRIQSRLLMGYTCEIKMPDDRVKAQYIDHYSNLYQVSLADDIRKFISGSTRNIREVKMLLNICEMLHMGQNLNLEALIRKTPQSVADVIEIKSQDLFHNVYSILRDYFGAPLHPSPSKKRNVATGKVDSATYYLLAEKMQQRELRERLKIDPKHHGYYMKRGMEQYEALPDGVKIKLREITG